MQYFKKEVSEQISQIIKSFWQIDSEESRTIRREKIIPDGYPEMIFHYEEPYRSNINGQWILQDKLIVAGQIRNHFFLENTGKSGMFAIKFQPWALKVLFNMDMAGITDQVISIGPNVLREIESVKDKAIKNEPFESKVEFIEDWFTKYLIQNPIERKSGLKAVQLILEKNGSISIEQVLKQVGTSERSLERYFKDHIGLSPKFYSRIIRFAHIFKLVQNDNNNWSQVTYQAGFYDQSHFIKNFKEFTGEDPSNYGFSKENMANFFLVKP